MFIFCKCQKIVLVCHKNQYYVHVCTILESSKKQDITYISNNLLLRKIIYYRRHDFNHHFNEDVHGNKCSPFGPK